MSDWDILISSSCLMICAYCALISLSTRLSSGCQNCSMRHPPFSSAAVSHLCGGFGEDRREAGEEPRELGLDRRRDSGTCCLDGLLQSRLEVGREDPDLGQVGGGFGFRLGEEAL